MKFEQSPSGHEGPRSVKTVDKRGHPLGESLPLSRRLESGMLSEMRLFNPAILRVLRDPQSCFRDTDEGAPGTGVGGPPDPNSSDSTSVLSG